MFGYLGVLRLGPVTLLTGVASFLAAPGLVWVLVWTSSSSRPVTSTMLGRRSSTFSAPPAVLSAEFVTCSRKSKYSPLLIAVAARPRRAPPPPPPLLPPCPRALPTVPPCPRGPPPVPPCLRGPLLLPPRARTPLPPLPRPRTLRPRPRPPCIDEAQVDFLFLASTSRKY